MYLLSDKVIVPPLVQLWSPDDRLRVAFSVLQSTTICVLSADAMTAKTKGPTAE